MSKKSQKKSEEECKHPKDSEEKSLWEKYCPDCPPWQRVALYSVPILLILPILLRKLFCPPKCAKPNKCFKPPPGCCIPVKYTCNKPRDCRHREHKK